MVKFIVEVSEGYIRERSDMDNFMELAKCNENPLRAMADYLVFKGISRNVEKGQSEFKISSKDCIGQDSNELFNSAVSYIAALALKSMSED